MHLNFNFINVYTQKQKELLSDKCRHIVNFYND